MSSELIEELENRFILGEQAVIVRLINEQLLRNFTPNEIRDKYDLDTCLVWDVLRGRGLGWTRKQIDKISKFLGRAGKRGRPRFIGESLSDYYMLPSAYYGIIGGDYSLNETTKF